ncbi:hypothetical protein SAMN04487769_2519 [Burkholderia sp. b14]|nr:hypothetical protein [Burkholderia sp. b13]SIT70772.1 hypothetical protein SAMN04487768_2054 [Burkholderia sp. b13]SIT75475.1 hypothetical protein SAMN04487769_2519 [Burkholderia sp. b14]
MMFLARLLTDSAVLTRFVVDEENLNSSNIPIHYNTLEGNQPNTYDNKFFVWQTDGWEVNGSPDNTFPIDSDHASGPITFTDVGLTDANYLLGYAVGNDPKAVATTCRLETQGGGKYKVITPEADEAFLFETTNITRTTVTYRFRIPTGYGAEGAGDWVGVWKGSTGSYLYDETRAPITSKNVTIDEPSGTVPLVLSNGQQFVSGSSYMLGYFKSGYNRTKPEDSKRTTLAAIIKFKGP